MGRQKKQNKSTNAEVYEYGALLLQYLEQSGYELITGPYCDTAFLFIQIERALREEVTRSRENPESFKIVPTDFSSLGLPQYRIDLSVLSAFSEYDQVEMEQWKKEGWDPGELLCLRDVYLYGEWWKLSGKKDTGTHISSRGSKITCIDSLSIELSQMLVQSAVDNEIPLHTVISIFYGLILNDHKSLELQVLVGQSYKLTMKKYLKIAKKIHDYWVECIVFMAFLDTLGLLKLNSFRHPKKGHENGVVNSGEVKLGERDFLFRNCSHLCQEEMFREMINDEIDHYIKGRYSSVARPYIVYSFFFIENISNKTRVLLEIEEGVERAYVSDLVRFENEELGIYPDKSIRYTPLEKQYGDQEVKATYKDKQCRDFYENYELGLEVTDKLLKETVLRKYCLKGDKKNILGYLLTVFDNVVNDLKPKKKYQLNSGETIDPRTLRRYQQEQDTKLTHEQIEKKFAEKKDRMRHARQGYLSQRKFIKTVFINGYDQLVKFVPEFPKLKFKAYQNRLKRLEEEKILFPCATDSDGKTKLYVLSEENIVKITTLITSMEDKRKKK